MPSFGSRQTSTADQQDNQRISSFSIWEYVSLMENFMLWLYQMVL